ncbi:MAG: glycosyltransferase [Verrucomicrobiae bacterium]|nr:glycosyltransferase [Verrucomicrobiae bacterium]
MILISVILPAWNEAARIGAMIVRTRRHLATVTAAFEILVVDDGSADGTAEAAEAARAAAPELHVVRLQSNQGKGEALRRGFAASRGRYVVFLDADMDLPPEQIGRLLESLRAEGADAVIGSKWHPRSQVDYPWHRRVVSLVYFTLTRILFGLPVRDTQTGIKIFRREALARAMPRMLVKAYAYDLELLVIIHHFGSRIAEAPVILEHTGKYPRITGRSMLQAGWDTLAVFYRLHVLRYYDEAAA